MLKKIFPVFTLFIFLCCELSAQKAYWVFFTDKNGTSFDPYSYFAPEAIERRNRQHIPLSDSTDFPVNENYIAQVKEKVSLVGHSSRWFNAVGVDATEEQIAEVKKLPFVREVSEQPEVEWKPACANAPIDTCKNCATQTPFDQVTAMKGNVFAQNGITGKGIIIAVIDVGFHGVDKSPAFESVRFNNHIRATFDFAKNVADVYSQSADHGTMVLSCIAGVSDGLPLGIAPGAYFLLAKVATPWTNQKHGEENFIAALEWSEKQGAMLVNCSDGPDYESYFPEEMNGKVSMMSRASNIAASKGLLVIAAAGNEGESESPNILPPAEADSVLCVTALNSNGVVADYSSIGPTPDFKRKPDVSAPGSVYVANGESDYEESEGTSFSAPLVVGFAACVIQKYPDLSPAQLMDTLHKCSSLYPYFDYAHGYGTPQASYFFDTTAVHVPTFTLLRKNNEVVISIADAYKPDCYGANAPKLFYNLENAQGKIYQYNVFEMINGGPVVIPEGDLKSGVKVNVFYRGYYASLQL